MAMGLKELLCVALLVGAAAAQRRQAVAENDVYIDDQASLVRSNPQYVNSNNNNNPAALAQVAIVGYEDPAAAGSYDYNYAVKDEVAGNVQQAREVRDGGQTQGSYGVLQPDGFFRSVVYRVEGDQGFEADVSYSRGAAAGSEQQYIPNDGRQSRSTAGTRSESAVQTYFPYVTVAGDGSPSPNSFDVRVVDSAELEEIQKQQQQVYQQQQQQVYQQQQQQVYQQQQPSGANSPAQEALYQPSDYYRLLPGQPQPINFFPAFIPASEPDIQYFTMSDVVLGAKKDGAPVQGQEQPQGNVRPYYPLPQHVVLPAVPAYESNDEYDDSQEYDEAEEDLNDPPADSVEEDFGKASPKVEEEQQKVTQPAPVQQQKQERVEVVQPDVEVAHAPAPFVEQKVVEEKVEQPVEVKITEQKPVEVKATTESPLVIKKVVKIPKPAFQTYNGKLPVVDFRNLKFGPGSKAPAPVVQPKNTRRQHQPKRGPKVRIIQSSPKHKRQLPQQGLFSANVNGAGAAGLQQLFSGFPGSQQLNGAQQGPGGFPGGFPGAQQLNGAQQGPGGFPGGFPGAQQLPGGFPGARQAPSRGFPGLGASPFSGGQFPGAFPQLSQAALRQFGQQQGNPFAGLQAGQIFPGLNIRSPQGSFGKRPRDDQRKVVEDQNELPDLEALGFGKNGDFEVREVKSIKEALRLLEQQGENGETVSTSNTQDDQEEDEEEPEGVVRQVFRQQKRQQQRGQGAAGLDTNGALAAIQAFNALSNPSLALGQQPGGQGSPNFPGAGSGFPGAGAGSGFPGAGAGPGFPGAGAGSGFPGAGAAFGQGFPGLGQPFGLPQPGGQPQQDGPQSQGFPGAPQFLPENDGDFFGPSDPSQQQSPFGPPQGNFRNPDNFPSQLASDVGGFGPLQLAQAGPVRNRRPVGGPGSNNGNRPGRNANRPRGNRPTRNTNDNGNNQQRGRLRNFPALNFGALRGLLPSFGRQQGNNNNNNRGRSQRSVSTQISVPEVEGERPAADFIPPEVLPLQGQRPRRSRRNRQNKDGAASSQRRRSGRRSFSV